MERIRVLIVDDEPWIRAGLRAELEAMDGIEVAGECGGVEEAVGALLSRACDLVLLDVQMPDGTGFDVIGRIGPRRMPAVVFVTAFDSYAIQAFEVNAVDYLLKPFDDLRLREALERARHRLGRPAEILRQMEALLRGRGAPRPQRLVVRDGDRYEFVPVDSIDWIESANNYAMLHCRTGDRLYGDNLAALERLLDPEQFVRVHRCRIVNLARVVAVHPMAGGVYELELDSGRRIGTGRQSANRVRDLLKG
ncbi:MAG: LytTR family DNA-binding domain-containing protein [Arcobacter sp.]|nr:LytTR family DNA-binding domain-containing protein [Bryobacteraceae bacterium]MDW8434541.1 LytTR family DNA-binding domain-containing protein [Arcobacter sp.]